MLSDVEGGGLRVFWTSNLFFIKENWICAMNRHAELKNILWTENLPIESDVKQ